MDDDFLILSNTVWGIPSFASDGNSGIFWLIVLGALAAAVAVWVWRTRVNVLTGAPHHRVLWSVGVLLAIAVIAFVVLGGPFRWSWPTVSENGRRLENGFVLNFGWISVTVALGLYTASHIAEIIRGSILAVPRGQSEAANALALSGFQRYRFVVLPQAARIAIPPTINQFLNLTKNTSLATVVGYPDITALIKTAIGNGKPAVQLLLVLMMIYLSFSFVISIVMNVVNRRMQLVDR
jgi:general L-amino acid transport system permease protein